MLFGDKPAPRVAVYIDRVMPDAACQALATAELDDPVTALDKPAADTGGQLWSRAGLGRQKRFTSARTPGRQR